MKRLFSISALICAFFMLTGFSNLNVKYTKLPVMIKAEPAFTAQDMIGVNPGEEVLILEDLQNGWLKVSRDSIEGYIPAGVVVDYEEYRQLLEKIGYPVENIYEPLLVDHTDKSNLILIGDSRTAQMYDAVTTKEAASWIAECGKGYHWFSEIAVPIVDCMDLQGKTIEIELGANDLAAYGPEIVDNYIKFYQTKALEWVKKGAKVRVISLKPIAYHTKFSEGSIEEFNRRISESLPKELEYIDMNTFLKENGFQTIDGVHYDDTTYQKIYYVSLT